MSFMLAQIDTDETEGVKWTRLDYESVIDAQESAASLLEGDDTKRVEDVVFYNETTDKKRTIHGLIVDTWITDAIGFHRWYLDLSGTWHESPSAEYRIK